MVIAERESLKVIDDECGDGAGKKHYCSSKMVSLLPEVK